MAYDFTVVTNCDRNYLWGAYLLIGSLRMQKNHVPVHALVRGFNPEDKRMLEQFGDVRVMDVDKSSSRSLTNHKAEAMLTANTEYIGWFDSDCVVIGDITKYWIPPNGSFQCRFRGGAEMEMVYRMKFTPDEPRDTIPKSVMDIWRRDVGQNQASAIRTTCTTDNFIFHRRHLDFIQQWHDQMRKVLTSEFRAVTDDTNFAYSQTDESVLNSLLAFSKIAPLTHGEYALDKDPNNFVQHFIYSPKPWRRWLKRHVKYYDPVVRIVEWAQTEKLAMPPVPWSLNRRYRLAAEFGAMMDGAYRSGKSAARRVLKP